MATEVTMPQLGETVVEGTISKWLKAVGDKVERFDPLVEIVTDKVTVELPSPVAGTITEILVKEGETVKVGAVLAIIEEVEGAAKPVEAPPAAKPAEAAVGAKAEAAPAAREAAPPEEEEAEGRRATPAVRRMARELGVDLAQVRGTGTGGRITREDVENYASQKAKAPPAKAPPVEAPPAKAPPAEVPLREEPQPLSPVRRIIAEHMVRSKTEIPHALTVQEVDMTSVVRFREAANEQFRQREGASLSYVAIVVKGAVEALRQHPLMNSAWGGDKVLLRKDINIGIAVAVPNGLIVPVIHGADGMSIAGLNRAVNDLAARARENKLGLADVQGGTFTVNNTGAFGSVIGYPIINHPQAAIMNMEAIVKRPVVVDDAIAIRSMMFLCLSFDHRILDGAVVGQFLASVRKWLEAFSPNVPIY
ncbi:MAG TPA: dihydrolipoamide acetyltransferase family protein [Dehalococcoidia bacterium]|nr:dihydrolipoamide acetyltransferase family protein [Dehalococcoidia bacterium]